MDTPKEDPTDIVIWSAPADADLAEEAMTHFSVLRRTEGITVKNFLLDRAAGSTSEQSISRLAHARIRLAFISAAFINALVVHQLMMDACNAVLAQKQQMDLAGKMYPIVPALVRPVNIEIYSKDPLFGKLQVTPQNQKPVQSWKDRNDAWCTIIGEIRILLEQTGRLEPSKATRRGW